ncbi:MAG TPA: hypothetical protein VJP84_15105 [Steroidobacteraceae bacterium]|jgi:hypothetical protein|nr:hypothetical protein [Steroidobacteraceae bacterium]
MTTSANSWILGFIASAVSLSAAAGDRLCDPLQAFLGSVAAGETRELKFHVIVGGNFKGREAPAYGARRCDYGDYEPGKALCTYLMAYGSVESPGYNAKQVIGCLSPKTRFAPGTWLYAISFATKVGTEARGNRVDVVLAEDKDLGGVSLSIKSTGY